MNLKTLCTAVATLSLVACNNTTSSVDEIIETTVNNAIVIGDFPNYTTDQTRAVDGEDPGKSSWDESDKIYVQLNGEGTWYTLTCTSGKWTSSDLPTLGKTTPYTAVYAPNYELNDEKTGLILTSDKAVGTAEYLTTSGLGKPMVIDFERNYSRLRIYSGAGVTETVTIQLGEGFQCVGPEGTNRTTTFELTPDDNGNIYLYGTWPISTTIQAKTPNPNTDNETNASAIWIGTLKDQKTISKESEQNTSYAIDNSWLYVDLDQCTEGITSWSPYYNAGFKKIKAFGKWSDAKTLKFTLNNAIIAIDLSEVTGMTKIPTSMFDCRALVDIRLPKIEKGTGSDDGTIGRAAFANCTALQSIEIPEGITALGNAAFRYCSQLKTVQIPEGLTAIGESALASCPQLELTELPTTLNTIGQQAFEKSKIAFSTIPSSVTTIGEGAFASTTFDTRVTNFIWPASAALPLRAFEESSIPSITISEGITTLPYNCFYNCQSLREITLPKSLTSIGSGALQSTPALAKINISGIDFWCSLNRYANVFSDNTYLYIDGTPVTSITIPATVTTIPQYSFQGYKKLTDVKMSSTVTEIGNYAFSDCSISSIDIPNSVKSIGYNAFRNCKSLTSINIPSSVTQIQSYTFSGCDLLTAIDLPNTITSIGGSAFASCPNLEYIYIPNQVTTIGGQVFSGCSKLKAFILESSTMVTLNGSGTFDGCPEDKVLYVPSDLVDTYKDNGDWQKHFDADHIQSINDVPEAYKKL
jgi:hypothetical protein